MTPAYERARPSSVASDGRNWTLAAHPDRYRVLDAVRDRDEDLWLTAGADLHRGDRVAIWKYKGRSDCRGIVAFGEVLTEPQMRGLSDEELAYWMDPEASAPAMRVRVRYVVKLAAPLWLEDAPDGSVIRRLAVSRAQGGTAHQVTADQWTQLMALAGGWPGPAAGADSTD